MFGEVNDPRVAGDPEPAWSRLARFQRWGARVVDARYIQPALAPHLPRDSGLVLIALPGTAALPSTLPGATVTAFVDELYDVTEHGPPDPTMIVSDAVALIELS